MKNITYNETCLVFSRELNCKKKTFSNNHVKILEDNYTASIKYMRYECCILVRVYYFDTAIYKVTNFAQM